MRHRGEKVGVEGGEAVTRTYCMRKEKEREKEKKGGRHEIRKKRKEKRKSEGGKKKGRKKRKNAVMELGIQCTTRNKSRKWTRALMTNQSLLEACTVTYSIQTGSIIASFSINCIVWYYEQFNEAKLCKYALLTLWPYLHTLTGGQTL